MQPWGPTARVQKIGQVNAYEQWVVTPGDDCPAHLATFRAPFTGAGAKEKAIEYASKRFQSLDIVDNG